MKRWLVAIAVFTVPACSKTSEPPPPAHHGSAGSAGSAAVAPKGSADPWVVTPKPDDLPSLGDRRKLVDTACPKVTAPNFYKIEKNGKASYILGTRHVSVPLSKFPDVVRRELDKSKLGVFEVAPDDDARPESKEISLADVLGPADYAKYRQLAGDETAAEKMPISTAILQLTIMYEDPSSQLESDLEDELRRDKVPMRGLETAAWQDALIDKLLDLRMLKAAVEQTKDRKELEQESHDDLAEYCAGADDSPGMDDKQKQEMLASGYTQAELDSIDEQMVYGRNRDWIPKLEKILQTDHVFIAVGVDHLIGPKGVVALLTARGYKVTRVAPEHLP